MMALNVARRCAILAALAVTNSGLGINAIPTSALRTRLLDSSIDLRPSYDYVIVGGGTAGLTVADRLTEDSDSMSMRPLCIIPAHS